MIGYNNIISGNTPIDQNSNLSHVVITRNNNVYTIYIDGLYDNSETDNASIWNNNSDIILGKGNPAGNDPELLDGNLDEIGIWNIALTPESIYTLYVNGTSSDANVSASNLIAHYKFNTGIGDTLYDHSGNGNHGTIHGATWVQINP